MAYSHKLPEKHDHKALRFPEGFLWGAATSAHQVEGNNIHSDWWAWEQKSRPPSKRSNLACDQYHLYEKDFDLARSFNHNAHRLSIEWARIEPRQGEFDTSEIEHYKKVLKALKDRNFKVMLTLWHFTLPQWVTEKGGWENSKTIEYFLRFIERVVPEIQENVDLWITLNEPGVYIYMSYLLGIWPPEKKSKWSALKVIWNLSQAHKKAYKLLHRLSDKPVGFAQNIQSFEPFHKHSILEQLSVVFSDVLANHSFYYLTKNTHDFMGINYYLHHRFGDFSKSGFSEITTFKEDKTHDVSDLGWEIYPEGLFDVLSDLSDHLPIYITECGIASTNDDRRVRFLIQYLQEVYRAIKSGVKVKGFFYWSLIDNFEWYMGFEPRFGLIEIDYTTQKRIPRTSAKVYAEIIKHNGIPHKLLSFIGHTIRADAVLESMKQNENRKK